MTKRGAALFALMSVVWGIPYLLIKIAVRDLPPSLVVDVRTAIGAAVLVPLALRQGRIRQLRGVWKPLLVYTVAELAVPWLLLSDAERKLPSSLTGLLVATVPLFGVLLGLATRHEERLPRRAIAGLLVGLAGVAVLLGLDVHDHIGSVIEVVLVALGYATGPMLAGRYFRECSSLALSAVSLGLVAVGYLPVAVWQHPHRFPPAEAVWSLVGLGLVCTALAFVAFFELIKEIGSTRATVITYLNPAVAVVLGVVLLGESFEPSTAVGFGLILAGSWFATTNRPRRNASMEPPRP